MEGAKQKAKPAKKEVFKKNYSLPLVGAVGKGSPVTAEHKKICKDFGIDITKLI